MNVHAGVPEVASPIEAEPYPPSFQAWYCVSILALVVMINFLDRGILNLLIEPIKRDLGLTDSQMSWLFIAYAVPYALLGFPVARLIDRKSRKVILGVGVAIWSVTTMATGLASRYWHLLLARGGLGVGETTSGPSAYSLMSDYFPPHRLPRAISVMQIGFVAGQGLALVLGAAVIAFVATHPTTTLPFFGQLKGWQMVLMLVAIPGFLVSVLMFTVKEPPRRGARADPARLSEVFALILRHKLIYLPMFIGMGLRTAQLFGTAAWNPSFFTRTYGWTNVEFGFVVGTGGLGAMALGILLGNLLAEHYWRKGRHDGNMRVVVLSTAVAAPLGVLFPFMPNPWLAAGCFLVAQTFGMMAAAPENAAIQSVTPNHLRGQMTFLFLLIMNVIGFGLGPIVVSTLTDLAFGESNIRYSLAVMGMLMGVPAIFIFWRGMSAYGRAIARGEPLM
jgi:MFS family permease